jgi:serine/threonine protein kinase
MGVVYRAQDLLLERFVALKFLLADRRDEIRRQRLLQEARAASSLDHPNICTIHEAAEDDEGNLFIAMRLCEGETLKTKIARGFVDLDTALSWASQAAAGLAHAHAHGIVHRDIKPANLILTSSGQVKIVDFGIALQSDGPRFTREGAVVGTVAYMSPEQLQGHPVDHRTDLWSLGIVLYELLTGRLPFGFAAAPSYPGAVLAKNPEPATKLRGDLPPGIEPLLARLLAKDPVHRHQQASELIRDLEALRGGFKSAESRLPTISIPGLALGPGRSKLPGPPVNPRIAEISVGRQQELSALAKHLLPEPADGARATVCAIQGMPGVGKSFLADRFAVESSGSFGGGYLRIVLDPKSPASPEALLGELADRLDIAGGDEIANRVRERLCYPRTLLHIENVDSPAAEVAAGRLLLQLPGTTVIVTGRLQDLGRALGWHPIPLAPFDEGTALRQLWGELGWQPAMPEESAHRELVQILGYLPLALHLAAGHLRSTAPARGRDPLRPQERPLPFLDRILRNRAQGVERARAETQLPLDSILGGRPAWFPEEGPTSSRGEAGSRFKARRRIRSRGVPGTDRRCSAGTRVPR